MAQALYDMESDKQQPEKILGYCHFCACKVTAANIGITVVAARDPWCNKPECRWNAEGWQKQYVRRNLRPAEKKLKAFINSEKQKKHRVRCPGGGLKTKLGKTAMVLIALTVSMLMAVSSVSAADWYFSATQVSTIGASNPTEGLYVLLDPVPAILTYGTNYTFTGQIINAGYPVSGITVNIIVNNTMIYATGLTNSTGYYAIPWAVSDPIGTVEDWKAGIQQ